MATKTRRPLWASKLTAYGMLYGLGGLCFGWQFGDDSK